jgi:hypothetical protein
MEKDTRTSWGYLLKADSKQILQIGSSWIDDIARTGSIGFPDTNIIIGSTLDDYFKEVPYDQRDALAIKHNIDFQRNFAEKIRKNRDRLFLHQDVAIELDSLEEKLAQHAELADGKIRDDLEKAIPPYLQSVVNMKKAFLELPRYKPADSVLYQHAYALVESIDGAAGFAMGKSADRGIVAAALTETLSGKRKGVTIITGDRGVRNLTAAPIFFLTGLLKEGNPFTNLIRLADSTDGCMLNVCRYDPGNESFTINYSSQNPGNGIKAEVCDKVFKGNKHPIDLSKLLITNINAIKEHLYPLVASPDKEEVISDAVAFLRDSYRSRTVSSNVVVHAGLKNLEQVLRDQNGALALAESQKDNKLCSEIKGYIGEIKSAMRDRVSKLKQTKNTQSSVWLEATQKYAVRPNESTLERITEYGREMINLDSDIQEYERFLGDSVATPQPVENKMMIAGARMTVPELARVAEVDPKYMSTRIYQILKSGIIPKSEDKTYSPEDGNRIIIYTKGTTVAKAAEQLNVCAATAKSLIFEHLVIDQHYVNMNSGKKDCIWVTPEGIAKLVQIKGKK